MDEKSQTPDTKFAKATIDALASESESSLETENLTDKGVPPEEIKKMKIVDMDGNEVDDQGQKLSDLEAMQ